MNLRFRKCEKMLEVVFSKSAEGALKVAQHCADSCIGSAVSVYCLTDDSSYPSTEEMAQEQQKAEERLKKRQSEAVSLDGNSRDVFCFVNDLSTGDISGDCLSENRSNYIAAAYSLFDEECVYCLAALKETKKSLDELIRRSSTGETIRIWYSEQPYEYCGVCWFLSELQKRMKKLPHMCAIKLPNRVEAENTIVNYLGWGGVCAEEFYKFLPLQKEVTPAFISAAALKWSELQAENSPLRAVINGTLQSVPEDFYDSFIKKEIDKMEHEFHEAFLIGNILGKYQLGIGDTWIALRIEKMIESGILAPITQPKPGDMIYRRMLRKEL